MTAKCLSKHLIFSCVPHTSSVPQRPKQKHTFCVEYSAMPLWPSITAAALSKTAYLQPVAAVNSMPQISATHCRKDLFISTLYAANSRCLTCYRTLSNRMVISSNFSSDIIPSEFCTQFNTCAFKISLFARDKIA